MILIPVNKINLDNHNRGVLKVKNLLNLIYKIIKILFYFLYFFLINLLI